MNQKANKILNVAFKVFTSIVLAFTVFMMIFTVFTVTTFDKNDRPIFGIRFYIVKTDSMSPSDKNAHLDVHFSAGDIILVKDVEDKTALQPGQIISFISMNNDSLGETITHMIRRIDYGENGEFQGYVTYGTNTDTDDEVVVDPEYVIGEYAGKLPLVGHFFAFVKSVPGYIVCILVPFLILILYNGVNVIRLFKRYKKEQNAAIEHEKAEIAEERQRNADMMKELLALKAQLEQQQASVASAQSAQATVTDVAGPTVPESSISDATAPSDGLTS